MKEASMAFRKYILRALAKKYFRFAGGEAEIDSKK